jgi:pimeloyl-ACP methyl ester carboxylesterase
MGHAAWCWTEHWMPAAAARGFDTYAVDLRGHGDSAPARRASLRDYAHDVLQSVAALPRQPVLVGHSMGALVVQRVLERYTPAAAALVAPVPPRHGLGALGRLALHQPVSALGAVVGVGVRLRPRVLFADLPDAAARGYADRLVPESALVQYGIVLPRRAPRPTLLPPVLVQHGGRDRLVSATAARATARRWGGELRSYPGAGHDLMLDGGWQRPLDDLLDWVAAQAP